MDGDKRDIVTSKNKKTAAQFARYIGPVLQAIRELGGSGRPDEVRTVIARNLRISDAEQSEPLPSGVQTRFENQVHWARFYLAKAGYIDSSQRGVWTLTEKGRSLGEVTSDEIQRIIREVSEQTKPASGGGESGLGAAGIVPVITDYRTELAGTLQSLPAAGFERFCQRLLRESGFQEVPSPVGPGTAASTASASFRSTRSSVSKSSSSARSTRGRLRRVTFAISAAL
jgi:restriction system protein